jgi:pSer/pThr/pTyr-binding forkhead associated (FHA) protein
LLSATNYASVIRPLQIIVLALAGLFLFRVMRVALVEVRPPRDRSAPKQRTKQRKGLVLEFIEPDQMSGERLAVVDSLTLGRGVECDIVVDDPYLSTRHAKFSFDDGDLLVEDLASTNGTYVNQKLIAHRTRLEKGDIVQVGGVLFEVSR